MVKILVVDDHDLVRMGIVRMLSDVDGFDVIGEARSGEEAIKSARNLDVDLVLMDVKMPGMGGIEATRNILAHNNHIKVIAVSSLSDELFSERLIKMGASGYLTKDTDFNIMIEAINKVMSGGLYMSVEVAQQLAVRSFNHVSYDKSPFEALSERELQTALMIANGKKVNAIADVLCVSPKTINSYRYRIFEKLSLSNDVELTILAVKHKVLDVELLG